MMIVKQPQIKGIAKARESNCNRPLKIKEFRERGKKVICYYCSIVPQEILSAAGLVPFKVVGSMRESVIKANKYLEPHMCGHVASTFDLALRGVYDGVEGVVVPHTCDHTERVDRYWWHCLNNNYVYTVEVPHWRHYPASQEFFKDELNALIRSLENLTGSEISSNMLADQVVLYNQLRASVRKLYELRKSHPPLISGSEITEIMLASMNMPAEEAINLIHDVIKEVRERKNNIDKNVRILIWGSCVDDPILIQLIEQVGANVVIDDLCIGTRHYWRDVPPTADPLEGLSLRYLETPCPVLCNDWTGSHRTDLEKRFGHLIDYARDFRVEAIILYSLMRCDTHAFWLPSLRDYLKSQGFPVLIIEEDYTIASPASLKTRVQAWVESIS
jgi:benzoyl-CoA reductase subunit C